MENILYINQTLPQIGLNTRKATEGEELQLVESFIDYRIDQFKKSKKNNKLAIFCEPQIETSYPDIIFAEYVPSIYDIWNEARFSVTNKELKILQHLIATKGADSSTLTRQLGIDAKNLLYSLEILIDANMVVRKNKQWEAKSTKSIFGIQKIEAVEAKISKWSAVLQQALFNKWFASESYALSKLTTHPNKKTIETFEGNGIGVYIYNSGTFKTIRKSEVGKLPSCYSSLMISEWIGRIINSNIKN